MPLDLKDDKALSWFQKSENIDEIAYPLNT